MTGASLLESAVILGQKTLAMIQRYAHLSNAHTASVVTRMVTTLLPDTDTTGGGEPTDRPSRHGGDVSLVTRARYLLSLQGVPLALFSVSFLIHGNSYAKVLCSFGPVTNLGIPHLAWHYAGVTGQPALAV
jgi:hypothetical protein